jgi:hypothetical protein
LVFGALDILRATPNTTSPENTIQMALRNSHQKETNFLREQITNS